jgi:uncharacterized DUF497 family protein
MKKVKKLIWNKWNIEHIKQHGVTRAEVKKVGLNILIKVATHNNRIRITGKVGKKLVSVILSPQAETSAYYVVTARDASKKEREVIYEIEKEKNSRV